MSLLRQLAVLSTRDVGQVVQARCRSRAHGALAAYCCRQLVLSMLLLLIVMATFSAGSCSTKPPISADEYTKPLRAADDHEVRQDIHKHRSARALLSNLTGSSHNTSRNVQPPSYQFYLHMTIFNPAVMNSDYFTGVYGPSPLPASVSNPTNFGVVTTFEAPLTLAPSNASTGAGTAQGIYVFDSLKGLVLFHLFTATIDDGMHKGTLCVMGQMVESDAERVLAVVGGTGDFLLARGVATNRLVELVPNPAPARWTLSFDLHLYY